MMMRPEGHGTQSEFEKADIEVRVELCRQIAEHSWDPAGLLEVAR